MRIAFDLDGVLIPKHNEFPLEQQHFYQKWMGAERLRHGTCKLLSELSKEHEVWIYTSSNRSSYSIYKTFLMYGIVLSGIVNHQRHVRKLGDRAALVSKLPSAFGIDILIDDEQGVAIEGTRFGFDVLKINASDTDWTFKIHSHLSKMIAC